MKHLLLPLFLIPFSFFSYATQVNVDKIAETYCDLFGKASVEAFKTNDSPDVIAQKSLNLLHKKGLNLKEIHSSKDEFVASIKQTVIGVRKNKQTFPSSRHFDESLVKSVENCKIQTKHALSQHSR
ncbi:hypothetical protein [Xenorhabdus budapestensis]|uniref:Uncharacterized protein n=1 Tax=Xenorhabdus budapestensis TaxID=290110 RepID=A0A2D0J436_XENBU|nr:hypothetical protein [Xenorhabdus budapestensis]PHM29248.1 hypothetical protein Xbud_00700 [Xenorhabdus budapestensis]